ncbi:MAG: hypothetical protein ACE5GM_09910 [bacterium]
METIIFDTLAYANKLKTVGVPEQQAEIQAETLAEIIESNLVTKRDLKELELRLKYDLTLRFGGMLAVSTTILAVLMKIL